MELEAIRELLAKYGSFLDRGLVDDWLALFAATSALEVRGKPLATIDARRRLAVDAARGIHLANHPLVTVSGDRAVSTQTFVFWNPAKATGLAGWYDDVLERIDGRWLFRHRRISIVAPEGEPE